MQTQNILPQQIVPVDPRQAALTAELVSAAGDALTAWFYALRAETDADLSPRLPPAAGKAYPYGRCEEITRDVFLRMVRRLRQPELSGVDRLLRDFAAGDGVVRRVWGALRGQYFQNAIQIGGLYVDVSNDTVVVTKPKIEILPMADSGLENMRDIKHFQKIAKIYWKIDIYANLCAPSLAPILPMISAGPGRLDPGLQSACDYMIALMMRDSFLDAGKWLRDGPPPPPDVAQAVLTMLPEDLRPADAIAPRKQALAACRAARKAGGHRNMNWRNARVMDFLRIKPQSAAERPTAPAEREGAPSNH